MTYIEPNIKICSTFDEAAKFISEPTTAFSLFGREWTASLCDIARATRNLIVGEPGIGKTLLLEKLELHFRNEGQRHLRVRLKDQNALAQVEEFCVQLPGQTGAVMLDALDEVGVRELFEVLSRIKLLSTNYPQLSIFLSLRWNFVRRNLSSFPSYRFVLPLPFELFQVREYLKAEGITEPEADMLLRCVMSLDHPQLVIQIPRYLSYLVAYFRNHGLEAAAKVSRNDLFEYFIYSKLDLEDKRLNTDRKAIVKRVLEKLALVMEIYQENAISQDELMTFFDEVRSDLKQVALAQVPLDVFFDASLLKRGQRDIDLVEFENTEFQEYLAAKEITRFPDPSRAAFRFAVDTDANEIFPSWFNALTFLVDMEPMLLGQLVDFSGLKGTRLRVVDEALLKFLGRVDTSPLNTDQRQSLFKDILQYHHRTLQWLPWEIGPGLARLFDPSLEPLLKETVIKAKLEVGTAKFVHLGNIAHLIGALLEGGAMLDRPHWRAQLLAFLQVENDNGVLERNALYALGELKDETVLEDVPDLSSAPDLIAREFLSMCSRISANHPKSIEHCMNAIRSGNSAGCTGLAAITEKGRLKCLLESFASDDQLLREFLDYSSFGTRPFDPIVEHIEAVIDNDLLTLSERVLLRSLDSKTARYVERSQFITGLWNMLRNKRASFVSDFVDQVAKGPHPWLGFHFLWSISAATLQPSDVPGFIEAMTKAGKRSSLVSIFAQAKTDRGELGMEVYEAGRQELPNEYLAWEAEQKENHAKKEREEQTLLEKFRTYLEPEPGKYCMAIFAFYNQHSKELVGLVTEKDRVRLVDLITNTVFKLTDPITFRLTITEKRSDGNTTYTESNAVRIFGDSLRTARLIRLDLTPFRQKIINFIPFANSEELSIIFEVVTDIASAELAPVLAVYRDKKSDLWRHMPSNLIDAVEQHHVVEAAPIVKSFVNDPELSLSVRERALRVLELLTPDPSYLQEIFAKYIANSSEDHLRLAYAANGLLIEHYGNEDALFWRLKSVASRVIEFTRPEGAHTVSDLENELTHSMPFAQPLMAFGRQGYEERYLALLDRAMHVWAKGPEFHAYAEYLWTIVYRYFDNLKSHRSYKPLRMLEGKLDHLKTLEGTNWLAARMAQLRRSYLAVIGKPGRIAEATTRYNDTRISQVERILNSADLYSHLRTAMDTDLRKWIEGEGGYSLILGGKVTRAKKQDYEKLIQKTLKTQIENILLRRGFQVDVIREAVLLDERRTDFLIRYGFAGPVVLEVKLTSNSDAKAANVAGTKSYRSMCQYMEGYGASNGLLVAIANDAPLRLEKITQAFQNIPNVGVIPFNLLKNESESQAKKASKVRRPGQPKEAKERSAAKWRLNRRGKRSRRR